MHTNASWICAGFNTVVFNSMGEGEGEYYREIGSEGRRGGLAGHLLLPPMKLMCVKFKLVLIKVIIHSLIHVCCVFSPV